MSRKLHRDFSGLELAVDLELEKRAAGVLGDPASTAGALGQTALYMTPGVGSALSIADGIKDFRNGNWKRGLWNLGLGIGTGIADLGSFGLIGSGLRGTAMAARAAKAARAISNTGRAGRAAVSMGKGAVRLGKGAVKGYGKINRGLNKYKLTRWGNQWFNPIEQLRPSRSAIINAQARGLWSEGGVLGGHLGTLMDNGFTDADGNFDGFTWDKYRQYDRNHDPEYYDRMNRINARSGDVVNGTRYW